MHTSDIYMQRCLQLAQLGAGYAAPNPLVGAVLVHNNEVIGEGYHAIYGQAHAEVNCINNVAGHNKKCIPNSTLYVSLEPCSHFGKTPPCVDLILHNNIKNVCIGCTDSFEKVNGNGIQKLINAGVNVNIGIVEKESRALNKRFFTFNEKKRPYIILKWAQTNNGFIAAKNGEPLKISNHYTNIFTHKYRAEEAAILVGTNTVLKDNPTLTTRNWVGKNPTRVIIDMALKIEQTVNIFNDAAPTIIINNIKNEVVNNISYKKIGTNFLPSLIQILVAQNINSIIIEGGAKTLQTFIDANLWDEAIVITNSILNINEGVKAPILTDGIFIKSDQILTDTLSFYKQQHNEFL